MAGYKLKAFKGNNKKLLRRLTVKLFNEGFFNCYLSPQLFNLLSFILKSSDNQSIKSEVDEQKLAAWEALMDCNLFVEFLNDNATDVSKKRDKKSLSGVEHVNPDNGGDDSGEGDGNDDNADDDDDDDVKMTMMNDESYYADGSVEEGRVLNSSVDNDLYLKPGFGSARNLCITLRYLLYEQAVDYFYDEFNNRDSKFHDFELLDEEHDANKDEKSAKNLHDLSKSSEDNVSNTVNDADDDNYDDDSPKIERGDVSSEDDDYDDDDDDGDEDNTKDNNNDNSAKVISTGIPVGLNDKESEEDKSLNDENSKVDDENDVSSPKYIEPGSHGEMILKVPESVILSKPNYPSLPNSFSPADEAIGKVVHPILSTSSAIESSLEKQNELKLIKNFNKIYHGFDDDLQNIVKRRKLEKSNQQLGLESGESNSSKTDGKLDQSVSKLMSLGGAANLSLKNLLGRIEDNRSKLNITDIELKNLIMDVRKNRSKWANYNRIGQEELYEACEKVVTELRGYTEHSTPFLNRVSKREAPNYYEIIKKPMDLNTVMRKLRNFQYRSKKQFVDDLMLIWQNCLTYNTDPKHYLRVDAIAMQKKTQSLIPLIPDIVVRDRAEVEKEAALAAKQDKEEQDSEQETENATRSGRAVGAVGTGSKQTAKKHRKGPTQEDNQEEVESKEKTAALDSKTEEETTTISATPVGTDTPSTAHDEKHLPINLTKSVSKVDSMTPAPASGASGTSPQNIDEENDELDEALEELRTERNEDDDDNDVIEDLEAATWKTLTANTRYKLCEARGKMFKGNKIDPNVESLYRDENQMANFMNYLTDNGDLVIHKNRYFDEHDDPYLIEYDVRGGVPPIKFRGVNFEQEENAMMEKLLGKGETLDSLPDSLLKVKIKGSNSVIMDNIKTMQQIRKTCFRINLIRQMQTSQFVHRSQMSAPDIKEINFNDIDPLSKLPTRNSLNGEVAFRSLQKSISVILMATGFEKTSPFCASLMTQLAEEHLGNLAKSMKLHEESNSINKMNIRGKSSTNIKNIVQMSLEENGIDKPDIIYTYYKEYLAKRNKKLKDLKTALEEFLKELLRPGLQDINETQFTDNSDQFMTGEFSEEIGDDFFGFRELGLDKEFGILSASVPLHLLHSRLSYQFNQLNNKRKKEKYDDFKEFMFPKLRKKDLPKQIGVLKHYYKRLLTKSETMYAKQLRRHQQHIANGTADPNEKFVEYKDLNDLRIIEDDDLPIKQRNNRPKIPPNGKITQIKKKLIATSFFIDDQDKWVAEEKKKTQAHETINTEKSYSSDQLDATSSVTDGKVSKENAGYSVIRKVVNDSLDNDHKESVETEQKDSNGILDTINEVGEDDNDEDEEKGDDKDIFTDASQGDIDDKDISSDKLKAEDIGDA